MLCWLEWPAPTQEGHQLRTTIRRESGDLSCSTLLRQALFGFIGEYSGWGTAQSAQYIQLSQRLTSASSALVKERTEPRPVVLDPFAGGGAIPFEALRIGAVSIACDLNPLAALLNRTVLMYVPTFGAQLAELVSEYGQRVLSRAKARLGKYYRNSDDQGELIGYLWARCIRCEGPSCGRRVPIVRSLVLSERKHAKAALRLVTGRDGFSPEIIRGAAASRITGGTSRRSSVTCPACGYTTKRTRVEVQANEQGLPIQLLAVAYRKADASRSYRAPTKDDFETLAAR